MPSSSETKTPSRRGRPSKMPPPDPAEIARWAAVAAAMNVARPV